MFVKCWLLRDLSVYSLPDTIQVCLAYCIHVCVSRITDSMSVFCTQEQLAITVDVCHVLVRLTTLWPTVPRQVGPGMVRSDHTSQMSRTLGVKSAQEPYGSASVSALSEALPWGTNLSCSRDASLVTLRV